MATREEIRAVFADPQLEGMEALYEAIGAMLNDGAEFDRAYSLVIEPDLNPWPEGVRKPEPDDPLYHAFFAAVYGFELNGRMYQIGRDGEPEVVKSQAS